MRGGFGNLFGGNGHGDCLDDGLVLWSGVPKEVHGESRRPVEGVRMRSEGEMAEEWRGGRRHRAVRRESLNVDTDEEGKRGSSVACPQNCLKCLIGGLCVGAFFVPLTCHMSISLFLQPKKWWPDILVYVVEMCFVDSNSPGIWTCSLGDSAFAV